jgi:uncharacterized membrane protein YeaQ/YmgE (transglycosylase-associated protein family)
MDWMSLIISLISGAVGGNVAGKALKDFDMGTLWNSVAGIVGGGIGGQLITALGIDPGAATTELSGSGTIGSIVSQVGGGGVGGAILLVVVSYLKKMFVKA